MQTPTEIQRSFGHPKEIQSVKMSLQKMEKIVKETERQSKCLRIALNVSDRKR